jgi:tight adherence protein C
MYLLFNPTRTAGDRLTDYRDGESSEEDGGFQIGAGEARGVDALAGRIGSLAAADSEDENNKMRMTMLQAGYKYKYALEIFNGIKVSLAICLPMIVIPLAVKSSFTMGAFMVLGGSAAGYYLPGIYITNQVDKRARVLLGSFPDSLDLLVSSVEAGLGVDAAFRRVAAEMEGAAPELAHEYQLVNHEISAGVTRVEAMTHLHERTGLDEVRSLVNLLSQSERFGTSVAKSLRIHAKSSRQKRMSRAEEEAAKVSPKLTVVMILFLLPVLMSILIGPAMINVKNAFSK